MSHDIRRERERCADCNRNAPSQAATPPLPTEPPSTPFEAVFADFFDFKGKHYLVAGDRLSGWVEVLSSPSGTNLAGSAGLTRNLRSLFATFGVPEELASDGGPEFTATGTQEFLRCWGVRHRLSSASFPQSNGRAEVAVKTAKRLLMSNTGPTGSLDHDRFLRAILHLRNTPDPDCNLSPAQIIFGRPLRDSMPFINRLEKYSNPHIRPLWREAWQAKEDALRTRLTRTTETLKAHSRPLRPLVIGERVFLQNQQGPHPTKWDRSGVVVESPGHDQYQVKVDGSGRLTLRNRRFLRAFTPATPLINPQPSPTPMAPDHDEVDATTPPPMVTPQASEQAPCPTQGPENTSRPPLSDHAEQDKQDHSPSLPASITPPTPTPGNVTSPQRPQRNIKPPKRYEPETGTWKR